MSEAILDRIKDLALRLETMNVRLSTLEFRLNTCNHVEDTFKCDYYAKKLFNKVWGELSVADKLIIMDEVKKA